jgi:hypothetical protein
MSYKHSDVIRSLLRIDIYARRTLVAVEGRCFCFVSACRFRRKSPRFPKAFFCAGERSTNRHEAPRGRIECARCGSVTSRSRIKESYKITIKPFASGRGRKKGVINTRALSPRLASFCFPLRWPAGRPAAKKKERRQRRRTKKRDGRNGTERKKRTICGARPAQPTCFCFPRRPHEVATGIVDA